MRQDTPDSAYLLKTVLTEYLSWHGARISFLAHFLLALLKVRSVNLAELAQLLVRLLPIGKEPWYLTLDRTNWQFGKSDINFLVLAIALGHRPAGVLERARQSRKLHNH